MSISQTPNHPLVLNGIFKIFGNTSTDAPRGNMYGFLTTASALQCGGVCGTRNNNFELNLSTNTALSNTLEYNTPPNLVNKVNAFDLGRATAREEVTAGDGDQANRLHITVVHNDWDGEDRVHRSFPVNVTSGHKPGNVKFKLYRQASTSRPVASSPAAAPFQAAAEKMQASNSSHKLVYQQVHGSHP
ncbi:hypothetical protein PCANC_21525 [Puccinia coronata f. sp. avenae]|uniref:Uncharacterized protein n=1 Tax=Puccinia coronata f. sp. avenae TaxID=200324 RepID=A0A2N5TND8_9BASI|nr:hypothetical protein PCANC_21525 [Puccinia coronata f. sp. avenae]